jgi:hypothetical protein
MYGRGKDYFSYIDDLPLPADKISGLLKALGAPSIPPATLEELGGKMRDSGVLPALNNFIPSIVVDVLMATYPAVFPSLETMTFLEDISAPGPIEIAGAQWSGWRLGNESPAVYVLCSGGHSRGGVVFYIPEHKFLMLADETTSVPIWPDTDPRRVISTAQRAPTMSENGGLEWRARVTFPWFHQTTRKSCKPRCSVFLASPESFRRQSRRKSPRIQRGLPLTSCMRHCARTFRPLRT